MATRTRRIEMGDQTVVGVNAFTETNVSPLGGEGAILKVDHAVEAEMIADVRAWRGHAIRRPSTPRSTTCGGRWRTATT